MPTAKLAIQTRLYRVTITTLKPFAQDLMTDAGDSFECCTGVAIEAGASVTSALAVHVWGCLPDALPKSLSRMDTHKKPKTRYQSLHALTTASMVSEGWELRPSAPRRSECQHRHRRRSEAKELRWLKTSTRRQATERNWNESCLPLRREAYTRINPCRNCLCSPPGKQWQLPCHTPCLQ